MCCNSRNGFTLIELLVSMLILMVGLLALLKVVYSAFDYNMVNVLRKEGVTYGDEIIAPQLAKPFALISTNTSTTNPYTRSYPTTRSVNLGKVQFTAILTNVVVNTALNSTKSVQVQVNWSYKGHNYSHNVSSMVSNPGP